MDIQIEFTKGIFFLEVVFPSTKAHFDLNSPLIRSGKKVKFLFLEVLGSLSRPKELISSWKVMIELRILCLFIDMEVSFINVHVPMNND